MSVNRVVRAWTVKGRVPQYHDAQMERLRAEWPELAMALDEITNEYFSGKVKI